MITDIDAPAIEAQINYLAPGSFINRRYVAPGEEVNTGEYLSYAVTIRDARPHQQDFTLASHGFQLLDHVSAVRDFTNAEEIDALYPQEAEAAIRAATGADLVAVMGWMGRTSGDRSRHQQKTEKYEHRGGLQPPAGEAHVDSMPSLADSMAAAIYRKSYPDAPPYKRFLYTSFWRTFSPPPQDCPLALCDGRSVGDEEGVPNTMYVVDRIPSREEMLAPVPDEDKVMAAAIFRHNPAHRWWYFSNMTRDEALLFAFHDSRRAKPWRVPHTAFHDSSRADANPRESIELRSIAYFHE
jgi:hypothetical protein